MHSKNANECFAHISAYFSGNPTGHLLLVNTENYGVYQDILARLQADTSKTCICASQHTAPNGLPDVDAVISAGCKNDHAVLLGVSQALMLRGTKALEAKVDELLELSIGGYGVVLLDHCEQVLHKFMSRDLRIEQRVVLVEGEPSALPHIRLAEAKAACMDVHPLQSFSQLLAYLESISEDKNRQNPEITVLSTMPARLFANSVYPVSDAAGVYESLTKRYPEIGGATEKGYGTDAQWSWLAAQMKGHSNFASLVCSVFGATVNLSAHLGPVAEENDEDKKWLLWLSLMTYGEPSNHYLSHVLEHSKSVADFKSHLYFDIVEIAAEDPDFEEYLAERKRLLRQLPEDLQLIERYCEKLGRLQKDEVFYLSDESDPEKFEFVRCLSIYDYSEKELQRAVQLMSKPLALYLQDFTFDSVNTKVSQADAPLRKELTQYFRQYKRQKLLNRIDPGFLETVNAYALSRPYNKLQPRSSIVSHMDRKNTKLFFFDALGVEYLAFILAKCETYGLISEISIGHCELPSITERNKEFLQFYSDGNWCKIDTLDDLKHENQTYNYENCKLPIHLFAELDAIDSELRKIQSQLLQGTLEKAVIVSDHGASRLAVLYGRDVEASLSLEEDANHSGRCCKADRDPEIPCAAYENGFSILANYERFKGGRRADVEVHGGASLEEVLVPVIVLTKKPNRLEMCFVDSTVELKPRTIPELILYSNIPMQKPRLCVNGKFYDGEFVADKKHAKFSLTELKRKGPYFADVFEGEKNLSVTLEFMLEKKTKEQDLF